MCHYNYESGENREHETEVLLDSEEGEPPLLQSFRKTVDAATVHNSGSNNPNLVLIHDGVNGHWFEIPLDKMLNSY